jgi:hypothetical protein
MTTIETEESHVEGCEHQDDADVHHQPSPEPVPEERNVQTDDKGCHPPTQSTIAICLPVSRPFGYRFAQSISRSRCTAGAAGFLILIQASVRPMRYAEPRRLDTMPSQPSAQAFW